MLLRWIIRPVWRYRRALRCNKLIMSAAEKIRFLSDVLSYHTARAAMLNCRGRSTLAIIYQPPVWQKQFWSSTNIQNWRRTRYLVRFRSATCRQNHRARVAMRHPHRWLKPRLDLSVESYPQPAHVCLKQYDPLITSIYTFLLSQSL